MNEVCRQAIAHALVAAHRHVFGPLFWYILLPGAVGPVLYRFAEMLARRWGAAVAEGAARVEEPYGCFASRAYRAIDWLPVRLSAAGFAIVGNFDPAREDDAAILRLLALTERLLLRELDNPAVIFGEYERRP